MTKNKYSGYTNPQLLHIARQSEYSRDIKDMHDFIYELSVRLGILQERTQSKEVLGGTEYNG